MSLSCNWTIGAVQHSIGGKEEGQSFPVAIRAHAFEPIEIGGAANNILIRDCAVNSGRVNRDLAEPIGGCVLWGADWSRRSQPDVGFGVGINLEGKVRLRLNERRAGRDQVRLAGAALHLFQVGFRRPDVCLGRFHRCLGGSQIGR